MKNIYNIIIFLAIIILVLLYIHYYTFEGFTTYQLNYSTDIQPRQKNPFFRDYRRCICSSGGDCKCMFDSDDIMLQYYFD